MLEQPDELRYEFRIGPVGENGLLGCHKSIAILSGKIVAGTIIVVFAAEIEARAGPASGNEVRFAESLVLRPWKVWKPKNR